MQDFRSSSNVILKKITRLASGMLVNEENVKQMLTTLGVEPTEQTVKEAVGFLSSNSMEFTMENLYQFLKSKSIVSKLDMRKKN